MAPNFDKPADQKAMNEPDLDALRKQQIPALQKRVGMVLDTLDAQLGGGEESAPVAGAEVHQSSGVLPEGIEDEQTPDTLMRENNQRSLAEVTQTIPVGEHWIVKNVLNSQITVPSGAQLTITNALGTKIFVHEGGVARILKNSLGSEIVQVSPTEKRESGAVPPNPLDDPSKVRSTRGRKGADASAHLKPADVSAPVDVPLVDDAVSAQAKEELRLATEVQNTQINSLEEQYKGDPRCTAVLEKLATLRGTNPDDSVIDGIRKELEVLAPEENDANAQPAPLAPIQRVVNIPVVDTNPVPTPEPTPSPVLESMPLASIERPAEITVKGLLKMVPDTKVIVIKKTGKDQVEETMEFRRDGDRFVTTAKKPRQANNSLIRALTHGFRIDTIDGVAVQVATPDVAPAVPPAVPDAVIPADAVSTPDVPVVSDAVKVPDATGEKNEQYELRTGDVWVVLDTDRTDESGQHVQGYPMESVLTNASVIDLLRGRFTREERTSPEQKETITLPERPNEILFYVTSKGRIAVQLEGDSNEYKLAPADSEFEPEPGFDMGWSLMLAVGQTRDQILAMAKEQGWKQIDAPVSHSEVPIPTPDKPAPKEKKEIIKLPLHEGDKAYFTGTNGDGTIKKVSGGYVVEYVKTKYQILETLTEAQVQEQGEKEDWLRVEKMTRPAEVSKFVPLKIGEQAVYRGSEGLVILKRLANGEYELKNVKGEVEGLYQEDHIQSLAVAEGWEPEATPVFDEELTLEEPKSVEPTEAEKRKEHIMELRALVEEARFSYVETDYKQDNAFKKLKRFFGGALGGDRGDPDTEGARTRYNLALTNLKEAELDLLKKSGISGKELKEEMVRILNYYTLGERVQLKLDHQRVEAEDTKWSGRKVLANFEKLGNWYKSLSPKTRLIAGGLGLALGGVSLVAGGTGVGVLAGGAVLLKKIVTTSASGVFADGLLEAGEDWCKKWVDIRRQTERVQELEALNTPMKKFDSIGISEEAFEKLSQLTQADIDSLDKKFQKQKRDQAWRKTVAWSTAGGVGAYFLLHSSLFGGGQQGVSAGGESQEARLERLAEANRLRREMGASAPGVGTVPEAVKAASAPASAASVAERVVPGSVTSAQPTYLGNPSLGIPGDAMNQPRFSVPVLQETAAPTASLEATAQIGALRENYTVNAGGVNDGQKGLYGILERRLAGSELSGPEEQRVIESLANAMRIKLDAMTPEARALAGFHGTLENGKVNLDLIRPGDKIDFGTLLTTEEIQSVLDGETIEAPVEALSGSVVERAIPDVVSPAERTEILRGFQDGPGGLTNGTPVMTEEWANTPARNPGEVAASLRSPVPEIVTLQDLGNPARLEQFMSEHGELNRSYQGTLRGMKTAIFSLPQDMNKLPYIEQVDGGFNSSMAMANMDRVLETHQGFRMGTMTTFEYDRRSFPFKSSQVERLAHLVRVATDPNMFGPVGRPLPGEFVGTYLERMAALAAATHNEKALAVSFRALYRQ